MTAALQIGGAPVVRLRAGDAPAEGPAFLEAEILPGRGMMLLQAKLRLPAGDIVHALEAPPPQEAARRLDGGPEDFAGNDPCGAEWGGRDTGLAMVPPGGAASYEAQVSALALS
jgi:hypothetical protein